MAVSKNVQARFPERVRSVGRTERSEVVPCLHPGIKQTTSTKLKQSTSLRYLLLLLLLADTDGEKDVGAFYTELGPDESKTGT